MKAIAASLVPSSTQPPTPSTPSPHPPITAWAAPHFPADGRVFAGVKVYHFTGGLCAEAVVIGAAAGAAVMKLTHIVAVGNAGQGVIPPCGRCRQILMDCYPGIEVIVKGMKGEEVFMELARLLPFSHIWKDEN